MHRTIPTLAAALALLGLLSAVKGQPIVAHAQEPAPSCAPGQQPAFVFGFAALSAELGETMGEPVECEHANPENGDTLQATTRGLAFYRKATNTPTFTNGYQHWALTADGLVYWTGFSIDPPGLGPELVTRVRIVGSDECVERTRTALALLRDRAPEHFAIVDRYLGVIECTETTPSGAYVWEDPPRYAVKPATTRVWPPNYAAGIAHEGCHAWQYRSYLEEHGAPPPQERWFGRAAEAQCLDAQASALEQLGGRQTDIDAIRLAIKTDYWDVPIERRWW